MHHEMFHFNTVTMENLPEGTRYNFVCGDMTYNVWFPHQITAATLLELGPNTQISLYETSISVPKFASDTNAPFPKEEAGLRFGIFELNEAARIHCEDRTRWRDCIDYINPIIGKHFHRISTMTNMLKIETRDVSGVGQVLTVNLVNCEYGARNQYDLFSVYRTKDLAVIVPSMLSKREINIGLADALLVLGPIIKAIPTELDLIDLTELKTAATFNLTAGGTASEFYVSQENKLSWQELEQLVGSFLATTKSQMRNPVC